MEGANDKHHPGATRLGKVYLSAVSGKQGFPMGFRMHWKECFCQVFSRVLNVNAEFLCGE